MSLGFMASSSIPEKKNFGNCAQIAIKYLHYVAI